MSCSVMSSRRSIRVISCSRSSEEEQTYRLTSAPRAAWRTRPCLGRCSRTTTAQISAHGEVPCNLNQRAQRRTSSGTFSSSRGETENRAGVIQFSRTSWHRSKIHQTIRFLQFCSIAQELTQPPRLTPRTLSPLSSEKAGACWVPDQARRADAI